VSRPNVLFLLVDCLRADYLDARARRVRIPTLLRLARGGVRFSQMVSAATTTTPCVASMLTGLYSPRHGVRSLRGYRLRPGLPSLPGLLRREGYHAFAEVTGPLVPAVGFAEDFDAYAYREPRCYLDGGWGAALRESLGEGRRPEPWFGFVHLWELHEPRYVPRAFDARRFGQTPYERALSSLDRQLAAVVEAVEDRALIVVHGDHGERLRAPRWSRRLYRLRQRILGRPFPPWPSFPLREGHGFDVWEDMIRVPFVLFRREGLAPRTVGALTRQVDVMPTLLELLGVAPPPGLDGVSLLSAVRGGPAPDLTAYIEACGATIADPGDWRRGLRTARWKYIETDRSAPQLYDLARDRRERRNLAAARPETVAELRTGLARITAGAGDGVEDSALAPGEAAVVEEKLRELGYIE
jgi:arylsulfatase A-like enzyme